MPRLNHSLLIFAACIGLIALLNGCVSSVNEDYAVTGPKLEFALGKLPVSQSFVPAEDKLDAIQVMLRLKSSGAKLLPARVDFNLVDVRSRGLVFHSVKNVALSGQPQPVRFEFPAQANSRGKAYVFTLSDGRVGRKNNKSLLFLASKSDSYQKGRAMRRDIDGTDHDLYFRTEIEISAGTALHSFAGRLLGDKAFLVAYGLLLSALGLALAKSTIAR